MSKSPDNVYFNVNIQYETENPDLSHLAIPTQAVFNEFRTVPILNNPSDYEMSIVRFKIPGKTLPLFSFLVFDTATNEGVYSVSLEYSGTVIQKYLIYIPSNDSIQPLGDYVHDPYYYVYTVQHMLDMINTAFASAFTDIKAAFPAMLPTEAPYMIYNSSTQLISLVVQKSYETAPTLNVYMDVDLYETFFLTSFNVFHNSSLAFALNGRSYRFIIEDTHNNSFDVTHYIFTQESPSIYLWVEPQKIVFTSGTIPIVAESISNSNFTASNAYRQIVTDFLIPNQNGFDSRSELIYNPTAEYRVTSLIGNTPLYNLSLQIFWEDNFQDLHPFYLSRGDSISAKILFRKRKV